MASPGKIDASQLTGGRRLPQIPKELEGHVLVNQQHRRIIVAEAKRNEPMVLSFLAQARMLSRNAGDPPPHVVYGEYEELEQERRSAAHVVEIDSAMQNRARNLFREAARAGVSDIHIKVVNEHTEVLCRLHGLLQPWGKYRMSDMEGRALCRTIYASMADPGAADTTMIEGRSQDARISRPEMLGTEKLHGIRIATTPTDRGMLMVCRLLYQSVSVDLGSLGYEKHQIEILGSLMELPEGINIVSGVTNSGKSTALTQALREMSETRPGQHILTVEDPPEANMTKFANQVPVTNAGDGGARMKAFARTVRAAMRLDPNIVMVGEIRDFATAKAALDFAATGHLVWTTLHANGVFQTLVRLLEMRDEESGQTLNPKTILDSTMLTGIMSQRLVATLCPNCSIPYGEAELQKLRPKTRRRLEALLERTGADASKVRFRGPGCDHEKCNRGIAGRTVIAEIARLTQELFDIFENEGTAAARSYWLDRQGFSQKAHAAAKVLRGQIDIINAEERAGPLEGELLRNVEMVLPRREAAPVEHGKSRQMETV